MREIAAASIKGAGGMVGAFIGVKPGFFLALTPNLEMSAWVSFMAAVGGLFVAWLTVWSIVLTIKSKHRQEYWDEARRRAEDRKP